MVRLFFPCARIFAVFSTSFFVIIFSLVFEQKAFSDGPYIAVGKGSTKKTVIAYAPVLEAGTGSQKTVAAKTVRDTVIRDLEFIDLFKFLGNSAFVESDATGITPGTFKFSDWSSIGADFLIKSKITGEGAQLTYEVYLYETATGNTVFAKRYVSNPRDSRVLGHTLANDVVEGLTGLPGIFLTKIVTSCDKTKNKEIFVMDFDGTNSRQVTKHRSIALGPAFSPDNKKIAYSVYTSRNGVKNLDLYELDFASNTLRLLSNKHGINSGAVYTPDGRSVALTMSFLGNPDIFLLNLSTRDAARVTNSMGFDVDPSISPDGRSLVYSSTRAGMPMLYSQTLGLSKSEPTRLTFTGTYNSTPSWSPQNNKIVFASQIDKHTQRFDLFMINPDGTNLERLTKDAGSNEDPVFSSDGNLIVFSSNRSGTYQIYVMNVDGTFVRRVSYDLGQCHSPKWSFAYRSGIGSSRPANPTPSSPTSSPTTGKVKRGGHFNFSKVVRR